MISTIIDVVKLIQENKSLFDFIVGTVIFGFVPILIPFLFFQWRKLSRVNTDLEIIKLRISESRNTEISTKFMSLEKDVQHLQEKHTSITKAELEESLRNYLPEKN